MREDRGVVLSIALITATCTGVGDCQGRISSASADFAFV